MSSWDKSNWEKENLVDAVKTSNSKSDILRNLGLKTWPGNFSTLNKYISVYEIDISHFTGKRFKKGHAPQNKKNLEEVLVEHSFYSKAHLKRRLIENGMLKNSCYVCGLSNEWNGNNLVLVMDHINGVNSDNRIGNLRLLCPNCNSQQSTFAARNKKKANYFCVECGKKLKANRSTGLCMDCISDRKNEKIKGRTVRVKKPTLTLFCSKCSCPITKFSKTGMCFDCSMLSLRKDKEKIVCLGCGKEILKCKTGYCFMCSVEKRKKSIRPSLSVLQSQINELGYCGTARLYGVSDNAIRKWVKVYGKGEIA